MDRVLSEVFLKLSHSFITRVIPTPCEPLESMILVNSSSKYISSTLACSRDSLYLLSKISATL